MASRKLTNPQTSMFYSSLLFLIALSAQQGFAEKFASTELFTILGGFVSSLLFLFGFTFLGNFQEYLGNRTGWGTVLLSMAVAVVSAAFVHRVCCTTCILFSVGIFYEITKVSSALHPTTSDQVVVTKDKGKRKSS